ncbi:LuxR family transcriptional regulator [Microbispora sp. H10836]|uniref:LuxR family transcriptional regulator n=1 Tax=Microbispora sp. H10836 TaxID=2729106 RepID=UPI0014765B65|nr:LuxR family transcriptional regulator [Microbispora sp. H10836]
MKETQMAGTGGNPLDFAAAPSYISDVLYLIASGYEDLVDCEAVERLNQANISFVRGEFVNALGLIEAVLADLDRSQPAYTSIAAFRMLLQSVVGPDPDRWKADVDERLLAVPGPSKVVHLCIESDRLWHSGRLFQGLRLNQHALQQSRHDCGQWHLYALVLLAKKLTDMHLRGQAHRLVGKVEACVHDSGLLAFEPVVEALRSSLHLQAGAFEKALASVAETLEVAQRRGSIIGVELALSVAAVTHLRLGDRDEAAACLKLFHARNGQHTPADTRARAAFAEISLVAAEEGPRAGAEEIRDRWHLLATESACFAEDVTRPAWLVAVALRAGDAALAERALCAIERLAGDNREVQLLAVAEEHARAVYRGDGRSLPLPLDLDAGARPGTGAALAASQEPKRSPVPPRVRPARQAASAARPACPPTLTARESEVATLVSRGMTNRQVANELGLSPHTVNFHLRRIFRKFSVSSRTQLCRLIAQTGPVPAPGLGPGRDAEPR